MVGDAEFFQQLGHEHAARAACRRVYVGDRLGIQQGLAEGRRRADVRRLGARFDHDAHAGACQNALAAGDQAAFCDQCVDGGVRQDRGIERLAIHDALLQRSRGVVVDDDVVVRLNLKRLNLKRWGGDGHGLLQRACGEQLHVRRASLCGGGQKDQQGGGQGQAESHGALATITRRCLPGAQRSPRPNIARRKPRVRG